MVPQRKSPHEVIVPSGAFDETESGSHTDLGGLMHAASRHTKSGAQSPGTMHDVRHFAPAHAYGAHETEVAAAHVPAPSHRDSGTSVAPLHVAAAQATVGPAAYATHAFASFAPSQVSALHLSPPPSLHFVRAPWGSPLIGVHVPFLPVTSHASH